MIRLCERCGKNVPVTMMTRQESFKVLGESITIDAQVMVCSECGEELFCEELDNAALRDASKIYRERHKLLSPEEIKKIREQYGLSQRGFARLLNWGDKTIHRYENGAVQDSAHNSILLFLRDPDNMKLYLTENEVPLDEKQRARLLHTADQLEQNLRIQKSRKLIETIVSEEPSAVDGYKKFDYIKMSAMILFFAHQNSSLLRGKLLRLLYYSDMLHFKEHGMSISGSIYIHLSGGPSPEKFDLILGMMEADQLLHTEIIYDNGNEKDLIIPDSDEPERVLTESEREMLGKVNDHFRNCSSAEMSARSLGEKGCLSTNNKERISYTAAIDIQLD